MIAQELLVAAPASSNIPWDGIAPCLVITAKTLSGKLKAPYLLLVT